jgi:hypothetical protein
MDGHDADIVARQIGCDLRVENTFFALPNVASVFRIIVPVSARC